jgi:putative heme transporter
MTLRDPDSSRTALLHAGDAGVRDIREPGVPSWLRSAAGVSWRFLVVVAATALVVFVVGQLMVVVLPVLLALLLATVLAPPAQWLKGKGVPAALAAILMVLGALVALGGLIAVIIPQVAAELGNVGDDVVEGFDNLLDWLGRSAFPLDRAQIDQAIEQGGELVQANAGGVTSGILSGTVAALQAVAGLIVAFVLLFFFLKDSERITGWLLDRTPSHRRADLTAVGGRAWSTLGGYFRGTAIVAAVDAIGIGIGLSLIGVPLVLPLMLLTFFGGFLPLVGATVAGFVAVLVALVSLGFLEALLTLGVVVLVQQLESNILEPYVLGRAVRLHPIVVLLSLMTGAVVAGLVGAFLAVPVAAVGAAVGNEVRLRREAEPPGGVPRMLTPPAGKTSPPWSDTTTPPTGPPT